MAPLTPPKLAGAGGTSNCAAPGPLINHAENPPTRIPSIQPSTTPPRKELARHVGVKASAKAPAMVGNRTSAGVAPQNTKKKSSMGPKRGLEIPKPPPPLEDQGPRQSNIRRNRKGKEAEHEGLRRLGAVAVSAAAGADIDSVRSEASSLNLLRTSLLSDESVQSSGARQLQEFVQREREGLEQDLDRLSPQSQARVRRVLAEGEEEGGMAAVFSRESAYSFTAKPTTMTTKSGWRVGKNVTCVEFDPRSDDKAVGGKPPSPTMSESAPPYLEEQEHYSAAGARASGGGGTTTNTTTAAAATTTTTTRKRMQSPSRRRPPLNLDIWRHGRPPKIRRLSEGPSSSGEGASRKDVDVSTLKALQAMPPAERECVSFILALKPLVAPDASLVDYICQVDSHKIRSLLPLKDVFLRSQELRPPPSAPTATAGGGESSCAPVAPSSSGGLRHKGSSLYVPPEIWNLLAVVPRNIGEGPKVFGLLRDPALYLLSHLHAVITRLQCMEATVSETLMGLQPTSDAAIALTLFRVHDRTVRRTFLRKLTTDILSPKLNPALKGFIQETIEKHLALRAVGLPWCKEVSSEVVSISLQSLKEAAKDEPNSEPAEDERESLSRVVKERGALRCLRNEERCIRSRKWDHVADVIAERVVMDDLMTNLPPQVPHSPPSLSADYQSLYTERYTERLIQARKEWAEWHTLMGNVIMINLREAETKEPGAWPLGSCGQLNVYQLMPTPIRTSMSTQSSAGVFDWRGALRVASGIDLRRQLKATITAAEKSSNSAASSPEAAAAAGGGTPKSVVQRWATENLILMNGGSSLPSGGSGSAMAGGGLLLSTSERTSVGGAVLGAGLSVQELLALPFTPIIGGEEAKRRSRNSLQISSNRLMCNSGGGGGTMITSPASQCCRDTPLPQRTTT